MQAYECVFMEGDGGVHKLSTRKGFYVCFSAFTEG